MKKVLISTAIFLAFSLCVKSQETVTIYPTKDAVLIYQANNSNVANTNYGSNTDLTSADLYTSGYSLKKKALIGLDLSSLPEGAVITSANLYLYGTGGHQSDLTEYMYYFPNTSTLNRVVSSWDEDSVTWNSAASFTISSDNYATIPNSSSQSQDYVVDITDLAKDIYHYPSISDGILMELETTGVYRQMQFASSDHGTTSMHPKVIITYQERNSSYTDLEGFEFADSEWENSTASDYIDWIKKSGTTSSSATGPSSAFEGKYYAYIEASSPNYPSKYAYLWSPEYAFESTSAGNISFDYHMYGATMGSLSLEVSITQGMFWESIWTKSGNQGDSWYTANIDLDSYMGYTVLFRFVGTVGSSYTGDIGLDNINVTERKSSSISNDEHYVSTITPLSENGTSGLILKDVNYYDGLGRLKEKVQIERSPLGEDYVTPVVYDDYGRIDKAYLPYSANDGSRGEFRDFLTSGDDVLGEQQLFYLDQFALGGVNPHAYSRTVFEESPLNRPFVQGSPGRSWQPIEERGGSVENVKVYHYGVNSTNEVRYFSVNSSGTLVNSPSYYADSVLYVKTFYDEDGNKTKEFKDLQGKVVLKRSYDGTDSLATYYVYDDLGLLRYVLPPKALGDAGIPTSTTQGQLCYYYEYDSKKRMIEKKLPGVEPVYMIYDTRDRLVLVQDGELEDSDTWLFNAYDHLNRLVVTGTYSNFFVPDPRDITNYDSYQNYQVTWNSSTHDYNLTGFFSGISSVRTKTYYDDYDFLSQSAFAGLTFNNSTNCDSYNDYDNTSNGYFDRVQGQVTGTATYVLDGGTNWVYAATYYDDKYRTIQTQSTLYPQGSAMVCTRYDFVGNVLEILEIQDVNSVDNSLRIKNDKDISGRITDSYIYVNDEDAVLLSSVEYNKLGEVETRKLHSTDYSTFLQELDYKYNMRGWLTEMNNPDSIDSQGDLFAMRLYYDDLDAQIGSNEFYNGNISGMSWTRNEAIDTIRSYNFTYDGVNRITDSEFRYKLNSSWNNPTSYETSYDYDKNGNLTDLTRRNRGGTLIDDISYTYTGNGNMLEYIVESGTSAGVGIGNISGTDFLYDDNGNMYWDKNKDIKIDYNYLNLPEKIYEESGSGDELLYIYDAAGVKWMKKLDGSSLIKTMYAGGFIYTDNDGDAVNDFGIEYILNPEGKAVKNGASFDLNYNLSDHLGNTRVVFDEDGDEVQFADYYPFGMAFYLADLGSDNKYLYNGKELQDELLGSVNLDWYCYGARFYDPALGRWHVVDPAVENNHFEWSPYTYVYNNPIRLIDPFGLDSAQRADALAQAQQYIDQKAEGNQYKMGGKKGPGNKVDCSGLVSNSVEAGGESDPNRGSENSGVLNIESSTTKVSESDATSGNIVTFRNSKGYPYHTGMVKSIQRDSDGSITSFTYIHSSGGIGPNEATFDVGNSGNLSVQGFYKWDTKPDAAPKSATSASSVATQSSSAPSTQSRNSLRNAWGNFTYKVASGISQLGSRMMPGY